MTAQISPNRMEVSDRFPMLGFAVRTNQPDVEAEVVIASDIGLFSPQQKAARTAANFYSSREHGTLTVPRGDGVFVVPPDVLARFIGNEKLFFGLATGRSGNGGLQVDALPREGSPYVSLRGFTGRTLRRGFGGVRASTPRLEWAGDQPKPGSEQANGNGAHAAAPNGNGAAPAPAPTQPVPYDDGFGPMPDIPARESRYAQHGAPQRQHLRGVPLSHAAAAGRALPRNAVALGGGTSAREALDYITRLVEQVVDVVGSDATPPTLWRLGDDSSTFVSAWETVLTPLGWVSGLFAFLKELPGLARSTGVTLSVGPTVSGGMFDAGVGVVFAPDGQVALFGQTDFEVSVSSIGELVDNLKVALAASLKLGYNHGGLDGFASLGKVAGLMEGVELVVGAEVWLDSNGRGLGGAVSVGVGFSIQLSAEEAAAATIAPPVPGHVPPPLPTDARQRATRIGGGFGERIGQALDLGLDGAKLGPLLDTLDPPLTATPLGARAMNAPVWSIHWDDVDVVGQPTNVACWATAGAMLIGWRDRLSIAPDSIASQCGMTIEEGLDPGKVAQVAAALGLQTAPPACYTPEGFRSLIEANGPLWVGKMMGGNTGLSAHAVLVVGMYSDGTDHFLRIVDPWDRQPGTPGAPANYPATHQTGSRYIMRYEDFQGEYEMLATLAPSANVLIFHAGGAHGHTLNTATSAPAGYAMEFSLRNPKGNTGRILAKEASGIETAAAIAGVAVSIIYGSGGGDVDYYLPDWKGKKHPRDIAPANEAAFHKAIIPIVGWPEAGGTWANCEVKWEYNGTSIANVYVRRGKSNDTVGWGVTVRGNVEDDAATYARSPTAAVPGADQVASLNIVLDYTFQAPVMTDDASARIQIKIYGDGTYEIDREWIQHSDALLRDFTEPEGHDRPRMSHLIPVT
jgi:hypothetical protein